MKRIVCSFLLVTLLLNACSAISQTPQTAPPATTEAPTFVPTTPAPSNPGECGYQWAYQDLPALSARFQQSIQVLHPDAQATAFAFGENCVRADGSSTFLPMETDFNVTVPVNDLKSESDLGQWTVEVMEVITAIPPEQIVGPRPGRVSLTFRSGSEQAGLNFYIDQYRELPAGLSVAEVFRALKTAQ